MIKEYLFPRSVEEALELLERYGGEARIIAGGTDLVLQLKRGEVSAGVLVDITRIPEIRGIREEDGYIWIGATTTHQEVAESPLIQARASLLARACRSIGSLQIRNVGTIGGNLVNAMPAADSVIALLALDAEVEIASKDGTRWVPITEFHRNVGECCINPCIELVKGVRFRPLGENEGSSFQRLARRRALILPILNVGVVAGWDEGRFSRVAIAIGPVAPVPFRARKAEEFLKGSPISLENIEEAARLAQEEAQPRSSLLRGSAEYRKDMVKVLVRRALVEAVHL
ncbi:MAG: xanthine dehydrogenase family protein subunit M [Anaerolineae bacterium]|nr:xanthine dehydrogenase family protein subunit M [Anaerolineae bacterium]MDW8101892.1 xanthine dehydrogenase family protein subunit M [Anaerolineae bacterium]